MSESEVVPMVPTGATEGNTNLPSPDTKETKKRPSPALSWCFTWNNYPEDWIEILVPGFQNNPNVTGYIGGKEVSKTGTPHIQGYMEFKEKARPMGLLPKKVKWICARGSNAKNHKYCSKDGDWIEWGTCVQKKKYSVDIELRPWQLEIHTECRGTPDDRTIHWYWEPDGCAGKTTFQKWLYLNNLGVIVMSGKATDMKNGIIEYQDKNEELPRIVVINIPRCQDPDHISWQGIEEIKDMFFFSPKYHSGQVCGPNPHVFIFSNEPPPMHKLSEDRWKIHRITEDARDARMPPAAAPAAVPPAAPAAGC